MRKIIENQDMELELEILMKNIDRDFPTAAEKLLANLGLEHLIQFNQKRGEKE
ncbi:MAG: hypothetical protein QXL78_00055 [Methanocellales archaeon]